VGRDAPVIPDERVPVHDPGSDRDRDHGATAADIDSRLSTELCAGVVAAYILSRGFAKSGSRSNANDPRDDVHLGDRR